MRFTEAKSASRVLPKRLPALDGLRGLLALSVAYSHSFGHILGWQDSYSPIKNGAYAVDVFFILSGIVLYHAYKHRFDESERPIKNFVLVRFFRLWPTHIVTLVLVFVAFLLTQGILLPGWVKVHNSVKGVALDSALLSSLGLFGNYGSVNQPSWSISVEMWAGSLVMLAFFRSWIFAVPLVVLGASVLIQPDISVKDGGGAISRVFFWRLAMRFRDVLRCSCV
ncbi:acyltransferase family protein [Marinobacter koreensis]|uniref:acyltransferase family protein n=1 Tax=Marinobacter koreensis TaxID=335974 RepID=UPI003620274E